MPIALQSVGEEEEKKARWGWFCHDMVKLKDIRRQHYRGVCGCWLFAINAFFPRRWTGKKKERCDLFLHVSGIWEEGGKGGETRGSRAWKA